MILMQRPWPLHPQPYSYETLERYVNRLAACYGLSYQYFCLRVFDIPISDSQARRFQEPTLEVLQRLSNGTGVSVEQLGQMTLQNIWNRLMEEASQYMETPAGKEELERMTNQSLSHKL